MLLGLLSPTAGSAEVLGYDVVRDSLAVRRITGYLPGSYALPKELTARRFLRYVGALFGLAGSGLERRIDALLDQFELVGRQW
jgi:ABC-2 type transport system ATP-binding protein